MITIKLTLMIEFELDKRERESEQGNIKNHS